MFSQNTKRNILSLIARFCDPVGLVESVTINLELSFLELFLINLDWDSKIAEKLKENWLFFVKFAEKLAGIYINRCYF